MHGLLVFAGIAVLITLTPGPATAMVVCSALRPQRLERVAGRVLIGLGLRLAAESR